MVYKSGQIFYRFVTIHACDGQTDGQTEGRTDRNLLAIPRLHCMQRGKNQQAACGLSESTGCDAQVVGRQTRTIYTDENTEVQPVMFQPPNKSFKCLMLLYDRSIRGLRRDAELQS